MASEDRKRQVQDSQGKIAKLLQFLALEWNEEGEFVVVFRFGSDGRFESYVYQETLGILDEKFLFWVEDTLASSNRRI